MKFLGCIFGMFHNKPKINEMINYSTYLLVSSNVWHARLVHVNFDTLRWLVKFEHIHLSQNMDATHVLNQSLHDTPSSF